MKITVQRVHSPVHFVARDEAGHTVDIEGSESIGGENRGFRPMSLVLVSLATCSVLDAVTILKKQRQQVDDLRIEVEGFRAKGYPSPFTRIHLHYIITGIVKTSRASAAIKLAVEKYCSVAEMLRPNVTVEYSYKIISPEQHND